MGTLLIEHVRVLEPGRGEVGSSILVEAGRVAQIDPENASAEERIDGGGRLLTPGLIDMHTHGFGLDLFEQGPEALRSALGKLGRFGVTCVAPTLYTVMSRDRLGQLTALAAALDEPIKGPAVAGFHLEGPFLALPGAGASTMHGDVRWLEEVLAAAAGKVAAMSVSPDAPGIEPIIEHLRQRRIAVFMTHTRASAEQTERAIELGARHATHFYDVFPIPEETEPGVRPVGAVEAILADPRVTVDFIADGVHVHPAAIRAALAAKGAGGVALISDAYLGAGMAPGVYDSGWGYAVSVATGDAARICDPGGQRHGGLTGSCLTMNRGVANLRQWLSLPEHAVWQMATRTPASILGLRQKGTLMRGADADLVLWEESDGGPTAKRTWVGGECIFDADQPPSESRP